MEIRSFQHICIKRAKPPKLRIIEDSEIVADVDVSICGVDGIFRPVMITQDGGEMPTLTIKDAERLRDFLMDATIYIAQNKHLGPQ